MSKPTLIHGALSPAWLVSHGEIQGVRFGAQRQGQDAQCVQACAQALVRLILAINPSAGPIILMVDAVNPTPEALAVAEILQASGRSVRVWKVSHAEAQPTEHEPPLAPISLVVDALCSWKGRPLHEDTVQRALHWVHAVQQRYGACRVLALQVPAGLDADTGAISRVGCLRADDTLCWLAPSPGLWTHQGRDYVGRVWVHHPPDWLCSEWKPAAELPGRGCLALLGRTHGAGHELPHAVHKGTFGDVWLLGGAQGMNGAAILAAHSALSAGAGRVYLALLGPQGGVAVTPELMLRTPADWLEKAHDAAVVTVMGCGGGRVVQDYMVQALQCSSPLVLDADALNGLAQSREWQKLLAVRRSKGQFTVLTPHPLEAARLLGVTVDEVQNQRLAYAQQLADECQCTVALKGSGTVVASPGQLPSINPTGNARLATAGTGDVLAGWVGGAWAQRGAGVDVHRLVRACVYLHGTAVEADAEQHLPNPVLASDLHGRMAQVLADFSRQSQGQSKTRSCT